MRGTTAEKCYWGTLCPVRFALRVCPFQDGGFEGLMFKSLARRRGRGATGTKVLPLLQEGGRPVGIPDPAGAWVQETLTDKCYAQPATLGYPRQQGMQASQP